MPLDVYLINILDLSNMFLTFEGFPPVIFWHFSERAGPPTAMWRTNPFAWLCCRAPAVRSKAAQLLGRHRMQELESRFCVPIPFPPTSTLLWGARVAPFPFCTDEGFTFRPSIWTQVGGVCSLVSPCDPSFLGKHSPSPQTCSSISQALVRLWNTTLIYFPGQGSLILKLQVMPI